MDTLYWIMEYGKVFCGYLLLMFLWPSVVFVGYLKKKTKGYRFAFCATVPVVAAHTVVLTLGLLHMLNLWIVRLIFYGIPAGVLCKKAVGYMGSDYGENAVHTQRAKTCGRKYIITKLKDGFRRQTIPAVKHYGMPAIVLIYGMIYFSYGAFQVHSYGYGDLYTHHEWIYGLLKGNLFVSGVYPEAMHSFVYCIHVLFGVRIYSILLFMQGIHAAVFLISGYFLLRKVFFWQYTPLLVLLLFLTLDLKHADLIHSMFRLQITMPMEFGLHTVFLCAWCLTNYLHDDDTLFLFAASLAACTAIHFHTLLMLILTCFSFAAAVPKRIFCRKRLLSLLAAGFCGAAAAGFPMAAALMQGIPFHASIDWAVRSMNGHDSREFRSMQKDLPENEEAEEDGQISMSASVLHAFMKIYEEGYVSLYGAERAGRILFLTVAAGVFCTAGRWNMRFESLQKICSGYPPVILLSALYILVYAAPMIGLPDVLPEGRFFAVGHMMILSVVFIPADVAFSVLAGVCKDCVLWGLSFGALAGIYGTVLALGGLRGYLFYELTRYNSAVMVTNSIIDTYPRYSYTIVSPTDELYQVIQYGWHEELLSFAEKCSGAEYTIPSEYVFIYVEKKPLLYAQFYFFQGPEWLAEEKYLSLYQEACSLKYPDCDASQSPGITAAHISEEAACEDIPAYDQPWQMYLNLNSRTILESKIYSWCQRFSAYNPSVLHVYYEDDSFVCYYFRQDTDDGLYNLGKGN